MEKLQVIIEKIREKPELSGVAIEVIERELKKYLGRNQIDICQLSPSDTKLVVKEVRALLRLKTGSFYISPVSEHSTGADTDDPLQLLQTHASTAERLSFYPTLKEKIKELPIRSILDLGCGLNPLALATAGQVYYAYDIHTELLNIIKRFFKENNISGSVHAQDILDESILFPTVDLCILFKVLDILDTSGHKNAERLLKKINAKYFFISFSTKTLSGKPMNHPQRGWIERLVSRLGMSFETISSQNEIFYLCSRERVAQNNLRTSRY